jgi:hypothetical protein
MSEQELSALIERWRDLASWPSAALLEAEKVELLELAKAIMPRLIGQVSALNS